MLHVPAEPPDGVAGQPGPASRQVISSHSESLTDLLGGRRGAIDATLPPVAFVVAYLAANESVGIAGGVAVAVATGVAGWRVRRGIKPRAVIVGLLATSVAALIALRTGRAADFFMLQVLSNAASALAWAVSILIRWPLLGVVVGAVLGQRFTWRRDAHLLRAYGRGSWLWMGQFLLRLAVFMPLWAAGNVVALGLARVALSWPLVAGCLAASWVVVRRNLPHGHPGLRHPQFEPAG